MLNEKVDGKTGFKVDLLFLLNMREREGGMEGEIHASKY